MAEEGHGATVELGEQKAGEFNVKVSRDGDVKAGAELPVDIWVTGGPKVAAVRFWVGVESGEGSMKAKVELEKDNWHTHGEAPSPMPEGSKLWVEIEAEGGLAGLLDLFAVDDHHIALGLGHIQGGGGLIVTGQPGGRIAQAATVGDGLEKPGPAQLAGIGSLGRRHGQQGGAGQQGESRAGSGGFQICGA